MTRWTTRYHRAMSSTGSATAPRAQAAARAHWPVATRPGTAKVHPRGVSPAARATGRSAPSPSPRARPLSRLGTSEPRSTAATATRATLSRPLRVVDSPAAVTTTRERTTQVARATGAMTRAEATAAHCPDRAHTSSGRRQTTPVARPGNPQAAATSRPRARVREGATQAARARGSRVPSWPVRSSGTRVHPATRRAPRAPRTRETLVTSPAAPRRTAPPVRTLTAPIAYAPPARRPITAQRLLRTALRVRRHLSRTRVAAMTAPPSVPGRPRAGRSAGPGPCRRPPRRRSPPPRPVRR